MRVVLCGITLQGKQTPACSPRPNPEPPLPLYSLMSQPWLARRSRHQPLETHTRVQTRARTWLLERTASGVAPAPAPPGYPHLQAGVVAVGRHRELRAVVVSQFRVHEQIVLAFVAPRASSSSHRRRAAPPGHERRVLVHGQNAPLAWALFLKERTAVPTGTRYLEAPLPAALVRGKPMPKGTRMRQGMQTPSSLGSARVAPPEEKSLVRGAQRGP